MAQINITNEAARIVGRIAKEHPDCSIKIQWTEGSDDVLWSVRADNGPQAFYYVLDDEQGTYAPATDEERARILAGDPLNYDPAMLDS